MHHGNSIQFSKAARSVISKNHHKTVITLKNLVKFYHSIKMESQADLQTNLETYQAQLKQV